MHTSIFNRKEETSYTLLYYCMYQMKEPITMIRLRYMNSRIISFDNAKKHFSASEDLIDKKKQSPSEVYVEDLRKLLTEINSIAFTYELDNKDVLMDLLYIQVSSELLSACEK